ncbi:uncharacterized protein LOC141679248 [Apium graveolens]|uniref:uncharacterized protein LOC141679248 n=1 Tax=Apium graveolens TaxID=4045 RepID=UPI003D798C5F
MEELKSKNGSVTLSYPMLSKTNYTAWSLKIRVYMLAHGIWEAVEPTDEKTVIEDKTDKVALAAIYQAILEDILLSIAEKKMARGAWEAIRTMCLGADRVRKARVQTLKSEFENLCMKDTETIDEFCIRLNGLVTNIRTLGETVVESYVMKKILRAAPSKFLQITSAIEQFGNLDEMSIEETVGSLKAYEERLRGQSENSNGQLLLTEDEWTKRENNEGQLLLTREEWLKRRPQKPRGTSSYQGIRDKSKVKCFNCHNYGHFAAGCRQRTKFKELDEKITGKVRFGDGSTVEIKGKGTVTFKCKNGEEVTLDGVYYIPTLCNNIISLG